MQLFSRTTIKLNTAGIFQIQGATYRIYHYIYKVHIKNHPLNHKAMKKISLLILAQLLIEVAVSQIVPEWTTFYNSPNVSGDLGYAIAVDESGEVVVAGASLNPASNTTDALLAKFDPSGGFRWSMRYAGTGNWEDSFTSVAIDSEGNIYAAGYADEGPTDKDYLVFKIRPDGTIVWKSHYTGLGDDRDDMASDVGIDFQGNVYVTGSSAGYSSSYWTDFATIKYSPAGDTLWTARLGASGMPNDRAMSMAVDKKGYAYVTGYVEGSVNERYNFATVKYTPDGDTAWLRTYNGTGSDEDRAYAVAVDDDRNVYVTGSSWGVMSDFATLKYDSTGKLKWVARYNGPGNADDFARDIKVDHQGYAYVTGSSMGTSLKHDCLTIKYNPLGGEEWVARYNGPDNLDDIATSLDIDRNLNVYITGYSLNAPSPNISTSDILTLCYNANGSEKWVHRYDGPGSYNDEAGGIVVDSTGAALITGSCTYYQQSNPTALVVIKYATPNSVIFQDKEQPYITLSPNPAGNNVVISSSADISGGTLEVIDNTGRIVHSIQPNSNDPQPVYTGNLQSGFYIVRVVKPGLAPVSEKLLISR